MGSNSTAQSQQRVLSTMINCKISYSAPTASEHGVSEDSSHTVHLATRCGDDIMKGKPTNNMSLKWLKVTPSAQEGLYSKKVHETKL